MTGGAGFIGSHVADALIARGHAVTVLDDLSGGFEETCRRGRVRARQHHRHGARRSAVRAWRFDYVYHLAAYAAEGLSHFIKRFNYTNNVIGSVNLINAAVNTGVKTLRVHLVDRGLRQRRQLPMTEEHGAGARGSLRHREVRRRAWSCARAATMFGLDYVIFRPHNVYGERQNIGDRYRNVVGIFMNQIMQGEPMTIFGDGTQTRAFSYIDDVAPVIADAIDTPAAWNETFNIGADGRTRCYSWRTRSPRRWALPPAIEHLDGAPRGAARALVAREGAAGIRRAAADAARRKGSSAWRHGYATTAPGRARRSRGSRSPGTFRAWHMAAAVTGYHAAHLPEDPARAIVWKVVAEHLAAWVPHRARRARDRRRLLPMDQQRRRRAPRRG